MELLEYQKDLENQIDDLVVEEELSRKEAFFRISIDYLMQNGLLDSLSFLNMQEDIKAGSKLLHVDGYSFDETDHSVSLFICDYDESNNSSRLNSTMLDKLYWKMQYYLETACSDDPSKYLDRDDDSYKAAMLIRSRMNKALSDSERILKIHLIIITNRELDTKVLTQEFFAPKKGKGKKNSKSRKKIKQSEFNERPVDIDLWPIDRFYEIELAGNNELIEIDFKEEFDSDGIPCIKGNIGDALDYDAYIGIIPGKLLADIYIEYGSRVLEGNVRAFLGTKSAKGVNNGIKKTINNEPLNFFTYNNGIAVTATDVTTDYIDNNLYIVGVKDLQIINGGQTTATLAEAVLKKTNPNLEGIFVPCKITVIPDREKENEDGLLVYDQMVHDIARFANSQNKVTAADLFSNDPFHIWMEKASKRYLAPTVKYNIPTGWYYERARKKYQQEQFKLKGDELKRFLAKYPKKQIITKEQLAMYLTAIACKPHLCSKGKNWVMKEYGVEIGELYKKDKAVFNEYYFKKCVCAAIIYQAADYYLESNKKDPDFWYSVGGYKGNIVPYSISKIISSIPKGYTLNWPDIWNKQGLSDAFMDEIAKTTFLANEYFCNCQGVLISEYCKRESTWIDFRDTVPYKISDAFLKELMPESLDKELNKDALRDQKDSNELMIASEVINKGENYWSGILKKAKEENLLSNPDFYQLNQIISFVKKGTIPCSSSGKIPKKTMALINDAISIENKLNEEGVTTFFDADDDIYEITLTDYKMH